MTFCIWMLLATASFQQASLNVPTMTRPAIDNAFSEGEWQGATKIDLADGGEVWVGADDEAVYFALHKMPPGRFGFGCFFLYSADRILVLHASAQLGSAVYRQKGDLWFPDQEKYTWKVPDKMWREEHWQAGVSPKGTQEFAISRKLFGAQPVVALGYLVIEKRNQRSVPWPDALNDDTQHLRLLSGFNPGERQFKPITWQKLALP